MHDSKGTSQPTTGIPHHRYSGQSGQWSQGKATSHPQAILTAKANAADFTALGRNTTGTEKITSLTATIDSACQGCIASTDTLRRLGRKKQHLIPTRTTATGENLHILGTIPLRLATNTGSTIRELVYISPNIHSFFLSKDASKGLGLLTLPGKKETPHRRWETERQR